MIFNAQTTASPRQNNRRGINRRRKKSQHLLDVNIRSDKARAQRNQQIVLFGCKVLIVISLLVGSIYGCRYGLNRLFFANPNYVINQIEIDNEGMLPREQILTSSGIESGRNIFTVSLPKARQGLLNLPQVEDAQVQRILPDTFKITIRERHPIAWLAASKEDAKSLDHTQALMIDSAGVVLKSRAVLPEYLRLPVIAGHFTDNVRVGKPIGSTEVMAALALIQKASDLLAGRFDIEMIDLSSGYSMDVHNREHTIARLAFEDIDGQLQRLRLLLDYCDANQKKMETANLMVQRNVPVTFVRLDTSALPSMNPKIGDGSITVRKALPIEPVNKKKRATNGKG